ncbi:MAG: response regulator transcription factor [Roseateles sp.]|uniref:response regulator transcription factor n=1 Tax=Roseateles sp. TaxID=1971397 RepID=UPI004034FD8C
MCKRAALYGLALAAGTALLQWLDYRHLARAQSETVYVALVAAAFLGLGVWAGVQLLGRRAPPAEPFDGNPQAQATLGISPREREVLELLAAGLANKEIAARLHVSPHTVKTHVAKLYEKLGARRRTEAILKARELGLLR